MPFPNEVKREQAVGTEGQRATNNPFSSVPSGKAAFVAGDTGLTVGRFAWLDPADPDNRKVINSTAVATEVPLGFIARDGHPAQISTYLAESSLNIPTGFEVTVSAKGDYLMKVGVNPATIGQKVYANISDGTMQPADAGQSIPNYVETPYSISIGAAVDELATISL